MKKLIIILASCCMSFSLAQNVQVQIPDPLIVASQQNLLEEWTTKEGLVGKVLANNPLVNTQTISLENIKQTIPEQFKTYAFRVLKPNQMRTMEYSFQRINIEIDNNNTITRIFLG